MRQRHSPGLLIALVAAVSLAAGPAAAQGTIRGVLYDSLLTGRPVANATVVLMGGRGRATTDGNGRFDFVDVPAGRQVVAFWAPWLDSVALPTLQRELEVESGARATIVMLATPSATTYQNAVCGTPLSADQAILVGEIRDTAGAPTADIGVSARWTETLIGTGRFERSIVASADSSDEHGMYALCGLPIGSDVALKAVSRGGVASGEIIISVVARVQRRDLGVATAKVTSRVSGRVVGPGGSPVAAATVAVIGDTARSARTDEEGRFVLEGVPRRSTQLIARALRYVPFLANVELFDQTVDLDDLELQRIPQELEAVMVGSGSMTAGRLQFEVRRGRGMGTFITDDELRRIPVVSANTVSSRVPRSTAVGSGMQRMLMLNRTSMSGGQLTAYCRPRFYVDGYDYGSVSAEEEAGIFSRAKRIEVYTAQFAPPEYNDFDGCGAVVVWTN